MKRAQRHPGDNDPVYLVLERDPVISSDLIQTIHARGPSRVIHVTRPGEVVAALAGIGRIDVAFLEMRVDEILSSPVREALGPLGARLVLTLGEDVDRVVALGWHLLVRPFTERMVHDSLRQG